jgi:carbonic anhydrase
MEIREASFEQMDEVRALLREYHAWVDNDICFQAFTQELAELPGAYTAENRGALLLASEDGRLAGCVALRALDGSTAEMKRLYLRDAYRGRGAGLMLVEAVIRRARELGYQVLRLDTLSKMQAAQRVYESLGFTDIERYDSASPGSSRFMEKRL